MTRKSAAKTPPIDFSNKSDGESYGMVCDSVHVKQNGKRAIMGNGIQKKPTELQHRGGVR